MFKLKINLDCHGPGPYPNIWFLPDLPIFSLPTTFNYNGPQHKYESYNDDIYNHFIF